jgi:hypothetical protein
MSVRPSDSEAAFHLLLSEPEIALTARALRLLITDGTHLSEIRGLARAVLAGLEQPAPAAGTDTLSIALTPPQMKITHTALRLLLDDLQREQAEDIERLKGILEKLPDEHAIRAIIIE